MKNSLLKIVPFSLLILLLVASAPPNQAQTTTMTAVSCNPTGPWYYVDGGFYTTPMSAFWPIGSKHTLTVAQGTGFSFNKAADTMYSFSNWTWSGGIFTTPTITVTADPAITSYVATFGVQYQFALQFCNPATCSSSPGIVLVNGVPYSYDSTSWQAPGTAMTLQATPNPGWIFVGWQQGPNQTIIGFQNVVVVNGPTTIYPLFVPAKTVNFATSPVNLQVYADGVLVEAPASLQWGEGTVHSIATIASQVDIANKPWIYTSWSDGGGMSHSYTVGKTLLPETVTANFASAVRASFITTPGGLNLTVDGQMLPPPYTNLWGIGTTHTVQAPVQQTDAQGASWTFSKWDDGVTTPTRTYVVPASAQLTGVGNIAIYAGQSKLTVNSTVPGVAATVFEKRKLS